MFQMILTCDSYECGTSINFKVVPNTDTPVSELVTAAGWASTDSMLYCPVHATTRDAAPNPMTSPGLAPSDASPTT